VRRSSGFTRWRKVARAVRQTALLAAIVTGPPAWAESRSSMPPDYRPPGTGDVCPAIEEDYEFCSVDTWSGNCPAFVRDARRLGEIYRSELRAHPDWKPDLQNSIWWGCGSAQLGDLRSVLERLDTPQARAALTVEPYRSLSAPPAPAAAPHPHRERDCLGLSTQSERDACGAGNLSHAKAVHERFFAACQQNVAPEMRAQLVDAEASWRKLLPLECTGTGYTRDECLARAYEERTQSIGSMHPECAGGAAD